MHGNHDLSGSQNFAHVGDNQVILNNNLRESGLSRWLLFIPKDVVVPTISMTSVFSHTRSPSTPLKYVDNQVISDRDLREFGLSRG